MSKEKQIEEMAYDLCLIDRCKHLPKEECHMTTCAHCEAEALYNAGYRNYDWCCFAFHVSRNRAKLRVAKEFGCEYTDMRCKTLKKGVNVLVPMLVTHPEDKGYDIVQNCGYSYGTDEDWGAE